MDDGTKAYLHSAGAIAQIDGSDNPEYLLGDALGSRRGVTDLPGNLTGTADYDVFVQLSNEAYPEYQWTVDEVRYWDDDWKPEGYFRRRIFAEQAGVPVGYAEASHARGQFTNPREELTE